MSTETLYLFSSNIRPLYEQDILDLLAAPEGTPYQFRYEERYLSPETLKRWDHLAGMRVLVHFSLQQEARYHEPAFIPVRTGTVSGTFKEGRVCIVVFTLQGYATLAEPSLDSRGRRKFGEEVRAYAKYLATNNVARPYEASATLGPDVLGGDKTPVTSAEPQSILFERVASYLSLTSSFKRARFLRLLHIREVSEDNPLLDAGEGIPQTGAGYQLQEGKTYALTISHFQPTDVGVPEPFALSFDQESLKPIGRAGFDIASRYDLVRLVFHASRSPGVEPRNCVISLDPGSGVQGPRLRLLAHVVVDTARKSSVTVGALTGAFLVGLPALLSADTSTALKAGTLFFGAALLALSGLFGFRRD